MQRNGVIDPAVGAIKGLTAEQLVRAGREDDVIAHIKSREAEGASGR